MHLRGVGLICWVMHADPSAYNNCFLLCQIDTKKSPTVLPTYLLPFLLSKMQFYQKCYHEERFQKHLEKGPFSISLKNLVSGKNMMHISFPYKKKKKLVDFVWPSTVYDVRGQVLCSTMYVYLQGGDTHTYIYIMASCRCSLLPLNTVHS